MDNTEIGYKNLRGFKTHRVDTRRGNSRYKVYIAVGAVVVPCLILYLFFSFYYENHFYSNTVIDGINTSNMTVSKAQDAINVKAKTYHLTLKERNGITDTIYGDKIDLHTEFDNSITDLLEKQNGFTWPVSLFRDHKHEINTMLEFDVSLLKKYFNKLNCFDKANIEVPENAVISEYGENGYEIIPEKQGAQVKKDTLYEAVSSSILSLEPSLSLEDAGCYTEAKIKSTAPELKKALKKMNLLAGAKITYHFGEVTEILDGEEISQWISVDDNYKVTLDTNGIKEYVDYIGKTYNSFGRVRAFKTSYGDEIKVEGGDYGWWLNRSQEVADLTELIKKGEKLTREPAYFQTAQQYGKDDIGNTYVEVNLTAQHLFFYKEGELILETDFVSGNLAKDFGTPIGTYPVQYKEKNATLVGEDYETPVKYWMPFNKNIGFHDASWRDEFGKDIYLTSGSHGCINMPPVAAKKLFKYIQRGVAVVVYQLPGTENYDTKKENAKKK